MSEDKSVIGEIVSTVQSNFASWTMDDVERMSNWFDLMSKVMEHIETRHGQVLKGIEKASLATDTIVSIANNLYQKFTQNLPEDKINELRSGKLKMMIVIMENPDILKASTSFLKKVLNVLDTNNDGEVSVEECCFCIPMS